MRPEAPDLHLASSAPLPESELTPAENPLAKFIQDAMRRGFKDFETRLPELLKPLLDEAATRAATSVINALGERLYSVESDVRRLTDGEHESGRWRVEIERRVSALESARHPPTEPAPPPT